MTPQICWFEPVRRYLYCRTKTERLNFLVVERGIQPNAAGRRNEFHHNPTRKRGICLDL